jgi:hypothetical protein
MGRRMTLWFLELDGDPFRSGAEGEIMMQSSRDDQFLPIHRCFSVPQRQPPVGPARGVSANHKS